jgi:glutathione S-transferase
MKLHYATGSPNSRKVTSLIGYLGLAVDTQHVDLRKGEQRTEAFLARNPNGKVPVLEDGDLVLWESHAILVYLACKHPERGLLPEDARGRAEVERWMSWLQSYFSPTVGKVMQERVFKKLEGARPTRPCWPRARPPSRTWPASSTGTSPAGSFCAAP